MFAQMTIKGLEKLTKDIAADKAEANKALKTAIKVTAYDLRKKLVSEVKSGAPGGVQFEPLSYIRRVSGSRLLSNRPYFMPHGRRGGAGSRMINVVRYNVESQDPFVMTVGWTGPRVSKTYQALAVALQEGFESPITPERRAWLARRGGALGPRKKARPFLFLRKETSVFKTPARPVLDPFWRAHQSEALRTIEINFKRKMRGERI